MELLQEYDFVFKYKPGKENIVPDALSRRPDHKAQDPISEQINTLDINLDPGIRQHLIESYPTDMDLGPLYESCREESTGRYFVADDLLWINVSNEPRLCIPKNTELRALLLHDAHDSPIAGHLGFEKTYENMRRNFYWPRMARDTKSYIASCEQCQRNKPMLQRPAGLFKPLDIPSQRWDTVTMDFIVQLPKTARSADAITVFVDKLSKQVHFCASRTTDSAADVAQLFFDHVFRLHGMPRTIISDRDTRFTGKFWTALIKLMGTKLNMSTAFHPQSDGQTERANRTLEEMLRSYVAYHQKDWDLFLPMLEFAYNNSINPSTGHSPFYLNYGHHPLVPASLLKPVATNVPSVANFAAKQASLLAEAQDTIIEAQNRQKAQADKTRRPSPFSVGDMVLLSTENISAAAHANRPSKKLEPKYIGPFKIIEKVHENAFKLELPPTMRQHPVFNVDLLRPYKESPPEFGDRVPPRPPPELVDGVQEYEVEKILDYKIFRKTPKWLVQWKGYPLEDATWEPKSSLGNAEDALKEFEASRNG
jgi:transposase InsO family protein